MAVRRKALSLQSLPSNQMKLHLNAVTSLEPPICASVGTRSEEGWFTPAYSGQMDLRGLDGRQAGVNRPSLLRLMSYCFGLCLFIFWLPVHAQSLAPEILKIDPPSWWRGSSADPIRLLIRGRNLQNSQIQIIGAGVRLIGATKVNERGTYAFVNLSVAANTQKGKRDLRLSTPYGVARASFEVLPPLVREN